MIRCDIRPRIGRQHCEGRRLVTRRLSPEPGNGQERGTVQREAMLGFGIFGACEFKEGRSRHKTAFAVSEPAAFRPEVEHRSAFRAGRRKAERHGCQFYRVAGGAHDRRRIVDADVVSLGKIELSLMGRDLQSQRLHHPAVFGPGDMLLIIIAHGRSSKWIVLHWDISLSGGLTEGFSGVPYFPEPLEYTEQALQAAVCFFPVGVGHRLRRISAA
ncbi:hypothetical protein MPLSOD_100110 [Mesorhizobium sp. SOD10]|nr:hypothetical protein MPLSOD_100110 [Mesorhizobium sp. SOD10]